MRIRLQAAFRTRKLDTHFILRTALGYVALYLCIGSVFTSVILAYYRFMPGQPLYGVVLLLSSTALLLIVAADPLKLAIRRLLNELYYRGTNSYREALLNFASKIGNIINMDELANEMLPTVGKALGVTKTWLLVADENGDFISQFAYPKPAEESSSYLHLSAGSPIVVWLEKENTPLDMARSEGVRRFEGAPGSENGIASIPDDVDVLCPIKSRGRLVGILALGARQSRAWYTYQDMRMITATAGQVGPMIENAQLYSQAVSLSVTDGLTGLYNHRHFHKLLDQEIARSSRYGTEFSLIMLDIDLFKSYNDTFGHLSGDVILREVGDVIRMSIRAADTAFRYGGEEFTVILPETPLKSAYAVAERIRERLEKKPRSQALTVTASFGIAGWPVDGLTKEEIIGRADAALYLAKRTGRNKVCLSSELSVQPNPPRIQS